MKIAVFGAGFVGLTCAVGLARLGYTVTLIDIDAERIQKLNDGICPFHETNLQEYVTAMRDFPESLYPSSITYTTDYKAAEHTDVTYICVGTPKNGDTLDTSAVETVVRQVEEVCQPNYSIVVKSTLPVGTMRRLAGVLTRLKSINLWYVPEFLSEGRALFDFQNPARVVLGTASGESGIEPLGDMWKLLMVGQPYVPFLEMDYESAELAKLASNAMLATRVSFMNEIALIADKVGGDVDSVRRAMRCDPRIGSEYLNAGIGWGGYCLPKDVDALIGLTHGAVAHNGVLAGARHVNSLMPDFVVYRLSEHFRRGVSLSGLKFAVWGCAFKAGTDDVRSSQAVETIRWLLDRDAEVAVYDPLARMPFEHEQLKQVPTKEGALHEADALVILTHDRAFGPMTFSPTVAALTMKQKVVLDGVNLYSSHENQWKELGFTYYGVGRK